MKHSKQYLNSLIMHLLIALLVVTSGQSLAESKTTFYHYDLLGSPVATTDESGNVLWREEYSPWGEKLLKEDASHDNVRDYTGHVHDKETGLTYMQARYYDPQIGRFMGVDPVGFKEGNTISFNRYGYANNNPFKFVDPNGEQPNLMKGGGYINAQIDLHGNDAARIKTEIAQATTLLDAHPRTKYTFNAYPDQMTKFASLKEKYGERVAIGIHVNRIDKSAGTVGSQITVGYKASSILGQKSRQTALAAHGAYSEFTEKAILAHMIGSPSLFRSAAKTFAKEKPLAKTFKNKDGSYFGHLSEMFDDKNPNETQNGNFDHIENNLAE